jgi:hypothetical protein
MVNIGNTLYVSQANEIGRNDGRLYQGYYDPQASERVSWQNNITIDSGGFAYSSMRMVDETIHIVYEEETGDAQYSGQYASLKHRTITP